jgi:hypothetical protein
MSEALRLALRAATAQQLLATALLRGEAQARKLAEVRHTLALLADEFEPRVLEDVSWACDLRRRMGEAS